MAQDDSEAVRKEIEGTINLRPELSTVKTENEALQKREAELGGQIRGNAETWRTEEARIHDLEQNLANKTITTDRKLFTEGTRPGIVRSQ